MREAVLLCALAGCAYKPGSFSSPGLAFPGRRATIGCLDVAVERRTDRELAPVIGYAFANRCDHRTFVDLHAVRVIGRDDAGRERALVPYDPKRELRPLELDGRSAGAEAISYSTGAPVAQVCVDVASLAHDPQERWVCFAS